jgi:uncharacterized protein (TIGR02145 family)
MKKNNSISQKLWQIKSAYFLVCAAVLCLAISGCSETSLFNETVTDIDGNEYKTVKIGDQVWMAENLRVTKYRNGEKINMPPKGAEYALNDATLDLEKAIKWYEEIWDQSGACLNYNNDENQRFNMSEDGPDSRGKYGLLYNCRAITDLRGLAPEGYHIPTKEEWETLIKNLGGYEGNTFSEHTQCWDGSVGPMLMSDKDWTLDENHHKGNNSSGFNALPSNSVASGWGMDTYIGEDTYFWTSTPAPEPRYPNWHVSLTNHHLTGVTLEYLGSTQGYSIRCIKDYPGMPVVQNKPVNNPPQTELENNIQQELDTILKSVNTIDTTAVNVQKTYYNGCGYSYESKEDCMTQCGAFGRTCTEGAATGEIIKASSKKE